LRIAERLGDRGCHRVMTGARFTRIGKGVGVMGRELTP
jgi:hypothetical protein